MKKILVVLLAVTALSCGNENRNQDGTSGSANTVENVDESSGEQVSPQLEDSADRLNVDTVASPGSTDREKENELNDNQ